MSEDVVARKEHPGGLPGVYPDPPYPRLLVERFSGRFWTWLDREEFLVPKNVLDIVAAQTVTWMGLFYCPLLPLLNSVFLFLTFYIKKVRGLIQGGILRLHPVSILSSLDHILRGLQNILVSPVNRLPPVHPPEELQDIPTAFPSIQLHLLLPTGAGPRPAFGCSTSGLRDQQVMRAGGWEAGWSSNSYPRF